MKLQAKQAKRKGSVLVEYALVIAGIVVTAAVAVAVVGHKTADAFAIIAAILPGAHADDNQPIASGDLIPVADDGNGKLVLDTAGLVGNGGVDRTQSVLGAGGGETLVAD